MSGSVLAVHVALRLSDAPKADPQNIITIAKTNAIRFIIRPPFITHEELNLTNNSNRREIAIRMPKNHSNFPLRLGEL
jgi:hypothetical protein